MVWFWTRENEELKAETRYDDLTDMYVLVLHWQDGRTETERFLDIVDFRRRLEALDQALSAESWVMDGPPAIMLKGWRRRTPPN